MAIIDDKTGGRNYALPNAANKLKDDVVRLRSQAAAIDADVVALQGSVAGKSDAGHTHTISGVSGLQPALDGKQDVGTFGAFDDLSDVSVADAANGQVPIKQGASWIPVALQVGNVTNLETLLDGKAGATATTDALALKADAAATTAALATKLTTTAFPTQLATDIHAATAKTAPVDSDEFGIWDSVTSALRRLSWANIKATLLNTSLFRLRDSTDATKMLAFGLTGIASGATRTITMGDADVTLRQQAWELIATSAPAAAATVDFANLSAFRMLRISGFLLPATDNVALYLRTSTDNGATFSAGASDYAWQVIRGVAATSGGVQTLNSAFFQASVSTSIGNGTNEGLSFQIEMVQFNQPVMTRFISHANEIITDGSLAAGTVGGLRLSAAAENAVRLLFSSGNIASGYVSIEGMR